jgi:hypothetical protein
MPGGNYARGVPWRENSTGASFRNPGAGLVTEHFVCEYRAVQGECYDGIATRRDGNIGWHTEYRRATQMQSFCVLPRCRGGLIAGDCWGSVGANDAEFTLMPFRMKQAN